jgi:hypothetical protein
MHVVRLNTCTPRQDEEALSMRFRGLKLEEVEVPDARDVVTYDQVGRYERDGWACMRRVLD